MTFPFIQSILNFFPPKNPIYFFYTPFITTQEKNMKITTGTRTKRAAVAAFKAATMIDGFFDLDCTKIQNKEETTTDCMYY